MPINDIDDWSTTAGSNSDVGGHDIAENCNPGGINNAMREMMAHVAVLRDRLDVGSDVQAYNANLASLSGLTLAANKGLYSTGADTVALFDLNSEGRTFLAAADAAARQVAAGFGTATLQDFTDNDDPSVDPDNAGTRGNMAAFIAADAQKPWSDWVEIATTSSTAHDVTGIASGMTELEISLFEVSTNGTAHFLVQLSESSTVKTSGYATCGAVDGFRVNSTAGFVLYHNSASAESSGRMEFENVGGTKWIGHHTGRFDATGRPNTGGGNVDLGGTLDGFRLTTVGGTNTFDNGSIFWRVR